MSGTPVRHKKFLVWLSLRLLLSRSKSLFSGTTWISFLGLAIGVGSLVVSMAVMSGFEYTLKKSVTDVTGHLKIRKNGLTSQDWEGVFKQIQTQEPSVEKYLEYGFLEGILAGGGQLSGVILQGVDPLQLDQVLNLKGRLIQGEFELKDEPQMPTVLIGKGIAQQYQVQRGSTVKVVFPLPSEVDPTQFRRKLVSMKVAGVLDLGKKEYDDRLIIIGLDSLKKVVDAKTSNGVLLRIQDGDEARAMGIRLQRSLGPSFWISDWRDVNENLFEAVRLERPVVFFVILIIVIASAFNVSSNLYINVVKRYPEIGVLKALGLSKNRIIQVFSLQGLGLGVLGLLAGLLLGFIFCGLFAWGESRYGLMPTSVYRLDKIELKIRSWDLLGISISTLLICFVATLFPAIKGSKLKPVEGIKHE